MEKIRVSILCPIRERNSSKITSCPTPHEALTAFNSIFQRLNAKNIAAHALPKSAIQEIVNHVEAKLTIIKDTHEDKL